jgi:hypothetical protein
MMDAVSKARIWDTLEELAKEHLASMSNVPWESFADHLKERHPNTAGETFGCEVADRYYDVGDSQRWLSEHGGDIFFIAHATTDIDDISFRASCNTVVRRPEV